MNKVLETRAKMVVRYCPFCGKEGIEPHPHLPDIFNCTGEEGCKGCFHILGWHGTHWSFVPPYTDD